MLILPYTEIESQTLNTLIEEFVTRNGTDYGSVEHSMAMKVEQILSQLKLGEVCICYDEAAESCNILPLSEVKESL